MEPSQPSIDQWFSLAYEELRRLAARVREGEHSATLNPTALVHEAYVRLAATHGIALESKAHFMAIAARAMRRVLVDAARQRTAVKRGSGQAYVTLDEGLEQAIGVAPDAVLALDAALDELARRDPRASNIVQYRFFGGLSVAETANVLQLSESTVHREWQFARAWLSEELRRAS